MKAMVDIRPYESKDQAQVVALWNEVFPDDPPWNEPVNLQVRATNSAVVAFYRSLDYELEDRASLGKRLG